MNIDGYERRSMKFVKTRLPKGAPGWVGGGIRNLDRKLGPGSETCQKIGSETWMTGSETWFKINGYPWISMDIHGYPWNMDLDFD